MEKRHLDVEISNVRENLVKMAGLVEGAIDNAIQALKNRDSELAQQVVDSDPQINQLEITIENQCVTILARQQPVAIDLRFLIATVKINNDLERMGDHAVNIAQKAQRLMKSAPLKPFIDTPYMASIVQKMVKDSLDAFLERDPAKAKSVCETDDVVDGLEDQINRELLTYMMENTKTISQSLDLSMIAKNLERIADLATNICEEAIYVVEAKTIKHHYQDMHIK